MDISIPHLPAQFQGSIRDGLEDSPKSFATRPLRWSLHARYTACPFLFGRGEAGGFSYGRGANLACRDICPALSCQLDEMRGGRLNTPTLSGGNGGLRPSAQHRRPARARRELSRGSQTLARPQPSSRGLKQRGRRSILRTALLPRTKRRRNAWFSEFSKSTSPSTLLTQGRGCFHLSFSALSPFLQGVLLSFASVVKGRWARTPRQASTKPFGCVPSQGRTLYAQHSNPYGT